MEFREVKEDLFNYEGKAWLAHCISADFGMGKGIVTQFNDRYNLKNYMIHNFERDKWDGKGYCIPVEEFKVFNLVTKCRYFLKPTYATLRESLYDMKDYAISHNIDKIAMPAIGCGLDLLDYYFVKYNIKQVFEDTDVEIIVCKL